jgi:hypothetical protein
MVLAVLFLCPSLAGGETIHFDSCEQGKLPPDWQELNVDSGLGANWQVLTDLSAPSGLQVLAKMTIQPASSRLPAAIYQGPSFQDGVVAARMKSMGSLADEVAGLIWRYRDQANFCHLSANMTTGQVSVFRTQEGKQVLLGSAPAGNILSGVGPGSDGWNTLRVEFRGSHIQIQVNGKRLLDLDDATPGWPGRAGVWADGSTMAAFDDFDAAAQDRPAAPASALRP